MPRGEFPAPWEIEGSLQWSPGPGTFKHIARAPWGAPCAGWACGQCRAMGSGRLLAPAGSGVARNGQVLGKKSGNSPPEPGWDADLASPRRPCGRHLGPSGASTCLVLRVGLSPEQPVLQLVLGRVHVAVQLPAFQPVQGQGVTRGSRRLFAKRHWGRCHHSTRSPCPCPSADLRGVPQCQPRPTHSAAAIPSQCSQRQAQQLVLFRDPWKDRIWMRRSRRPAGHCPPGDGLTPLLRKMRVGGTSWA